MARYFNTTGPCVPHLHYMLPPADRLIGASLDRYVRDQLYWVLHAPRQTGKTTFLHYWMQKINNSGEAVACYVSVERCQGVPERARAMPALCDAIREWAKRFAAPVPDMPTTSPESMLSSMLIDWAEKVAPQPLVVLFDEVDVLEGPAMVSFLRQLRGGFAGRDIGKFPVSVALVGMRDLRDYLVHSKDGRPLNPGSPFNIKEDSVSIGNFSQPDIATLTAQHTGETRQVFADDALTTIWQLTSGQPWLVNALCKKCVLETAPTGSVDLIHAAHVEQARELLIRSRATHIDALGERLREERVRKVIQPMLTGETDCALGRSDRDVEFCMDLGLIAWDGSLVVANAIYREVIARYLSQNYQDNIPAPEFKWQHADGRLDMDALLREFQTFWSWHADIWEAKADYTEAFPHLLLMAFLQRVVNGGGQIEREYAAGRDRIDLAVRFAGKTHIIEIKLVHPRMGRDMTLAKGLEQIARYAATTGTDSCHLVIFDRRPEYRAKPWPERLGWEPRAALDGRPVTVVWA